MSSSTLSVWWVGVGEGEGNSVIYYIYHSALSKLLLHQVVVSNILYFQPDPNIFKWVVQPLTTSMEHAMFLHSNSWITKPDCFAKKYLRNGDLDQGYIFFQFIVNLLCLHLQKAYSQNRTSRIFLEKVTFMHLQKVSTNSATNFWILSESSFAWRRTSGFLFFKVDVRFHKEALSTNIQNKKHNIKCLVNTKNSDLLWSYLTKVFPPLPVMIFSSVKKLHLSAKKRGHLPPLKSPIWFSANHRHPAP